MSDVKYNTSLYDLDINLLYIRGVAKSLTYILTSTENSQAKIERKKKEKKKRKMSAMWKHVMDSIRNIRKALCKILKIQYFCFPPVYCVFTFPIK